ncbi:MAG TPA: hypothetical protein VKA84_02095, partial [Gemmatimonadaceae bacterium]|nr:hypothetical protein [Gemmatimonadaceae bacterium]
MVAPAFARAGLDTLDELGYAILPDALDGAAVDQLLEAVGPLSAGHGGRGGVRNLLDDAPAVRELARFSAVRAVAEAALGPTCFAVRGILFDKTPGANWKVIWHQDL